MGLRARSPSSWPHVEAEGGVAGQTLLVHPGEHGDAGVDVVVDLDVVLSVMGPEETTDVLDDPAFPCQWEGEEEGVERRPVEALPEVGRRGHEHDATAVGGLERFADGCSSLLSAPTSVQTRALRSSSSATVRRTSWIRKSSPESGSTIVSCTTSSRCIDAAGVEETAISWRIGPSCMVRMPSRPSRRYGVAVRPSHRLTVAWRTQASNETAGTWWHSSTTTRP
jgi:hypothetical protein